MLAETPINRRVALNAVEIKDWVRNLWGSQTGSLVALFSSDGFLEVAVAQGNAAERLRVDVSAPS